MEQVEENIEIASHSGVGTMSEAEETVIHSVREAYQSVMPIHCTFCEYCLPCPSGVFIRACLSCITAV